MSTLLEALFSSAARVQVLRLFLLNPGRQFYQREIERETGQPIRAVQREVERLEGLGLLARSPEANRILYRVDPSFPLLAELTALFRQPVPEAVRQPPVAPPSALPEPAVQRQPFPWLETPPPLPLPPALRRLQAEGEWDRGY